MGLVDQYCSLVGVNGTWYHFRMLLGQFYEYSELLVRWGMGSYRWSWDFGRTVPEKVRDYGPSG
jgi:hypothetical protein